MRKKTPLDSILAWAGYDDNIKPSSEVLAGFKKALREAVEQDRVDTAVVFNNRALELIDEADKGVNQDLLIGESDGLAWCRNYLLLKP